MNVKFLKNTGWIVGTQILKSVIGLVISILTARFLGPSNYGILGYVSSIIYLFSALAHLCLSQFIAKEIIAKPDEAGTIVGTAITMQLISSTITYALIVGTVIALNINDKVLWVCAGLQGAMIIFNSFDNISYYYQSRLESKYVSISSLIAYIIAQCYKIYLLATAKGVEYFAFAQTLDVMIIAFCLVVSYVKNKGPKWRFSIKTAKKLLKQSVPFIIAGFAATLYSSLDKIMLKELLGNTEVVGYYNVAHTISYAWIFILTALITSFSPLIYEVLKGQGSDSKEFKLKCRQLYCLIFWVGAIVSIVISSIASFAIKLVYGGMYDKSINSTIILTWAAVFTYVWSASNVQIICENKYWYIVMSSFLTAGINALLNWLLIPILQVDGAAIATLVTEFLVCFIVPLLFKKSRNIGLTTIQGVFFYKVNMKSIIKFVKSKLVRTKVLDNLEDSSERIDYKDELVDQNSQKSEEIENKEKGEKNDSQN